MYLKVGVIFKVCETAEITVKLYSDNWLGQSDNVITSLQYLVVPYFVGHFNNVLTKTKKIEKKKHD